MLFAISSPLRLSSSSHPASGDGELSNWKVKSKWININDPMYGRGAEKRRDGEEDGWKAGLTLEPKAKVNSALMDNQAAARHQGIN